MGVALDGLLGVHALFLGFFGFVGGHIVVGGGGHCGVVEVEGGWYKVGVMKGRVDGRFEDCTSQQQWDKRRFTVNQRSVVEDHRTTRFVANN